MLNVAVLATVFAIVFLAELPDKSLFASLVLGTRYRPFQVWAGVAAAFVVHMGARRPGRAGPGDAGAAPGA